MYWQVYLHKTAVSAEQMLISCISRAQELASSGVEIFATPSLGRFLYNQIGNGDLKDEVLADFMRIDDADVWGAIKVWSHHPDKILSFLSNAILDRRIFKIEFRM